MDKVKIAIIGTSWWTEAMYLPALTNHPQAEVSLCGRNLARAQQVAQAWNVSRAFVDVETMLDKLSLNALIIATDNDGHYPFSMQAMSKGLHVLCEKPLSEDLSLAEAMAAEAKARGIISMVPFTYSFMPSLRYVKDLIDEGYLGKGHHFSMRYYAGFGLSHDYAWRFDARYSPGGMLGDLGSHFLYIATWLFGEVEGLFCHLDTLAKHADKDPKGQDFPKANDSAIITLKFKNGMQGHVHATAVAYEGTNFNQRHMMEFHGDKGTLYHENDWDYLDVVKGTKVGEGPIKVLDLPAVYVDGIRRDQVHNTYKDVFREKDFMARAFITQIAQHKAGQSPKALKPDFSDGAYVQKLVDTALKSHQQGKWLRVH
ncbi:MAG: Gfo/Idh/MocA family oxidoreductase [Deinococcales bacterium]